MTKLEKLIQELCPEGVEYKEISEVTNYEQPSKYIVKSTAYRDEYEIPVLTAGQSFVLGYTDESDGVYPASKATPVIIFDDFTAAFKWVVFPFKVKSSAMKIITAKEDSLLIRFLFHWMGVLNYSSTEHTRLWIGTYSKFRIPVPPLPVQREIVRILDNFTEITQKLTAELAAELIDRKQQYEYYRNRLLTFDVRGEGTSRTEWRMFGETCFLQAGKAIDAENISKEKTLEYCIPCYGGNGLRGYVRKANQKGEKPLVGRQGALCGNVCFAKGDYYATEHAVVVTDRGFYNSRFLYHLLVNKNLNQYKTAGAQPGLSVTKLETILLPVPETEIQNRIADVLDNFDAICTDLSSGLPAEIEARQKQYEYYRDKLLTFTPAD